MGHATAFRHPDSNRLAWFYENSITIALLIASFRQNPDPARDQGLALLLSSLSIITPWAFTARALEVKAARPMAGYP
jgi:hypothetical protein